MLDNKISYLVVAHLSFALFLWIFVSARLGSALPNDCDANTWSFFSKRVSAEFDVQDDVTRLYLLLTVHLMHLYCYLPMAHLTKVLYGYWLGIWVGCLVCISWELFLLGLYLHLQQNEPHFAFQSYVALARRKKLLWVTICIVSLSSFPLQAKTLMVRFSDIKKMEYMWAIIGHTMLLGITNVGCGAMLAHSPTPRTLHAIEWLVAISAAVPTLSTILVSSQTVFFALRNGERRLQHDWHAPVEVGQMPVVDSLR